MRKRYLNPTQLRSMKVRQHWGKCWKEYPERMELNRLQATDAANQSRVEKLNRQIEHIRSWPEKMSSSEYQNLLNEAVKGSKKSDLKPDSLRRKFAKHKLITFDFQNGVWINHARLNQPSSHENKIQQSQ